LLPDATIVAIVDGRNADVQLADEVPQPESTESIDGAFAEWLGDQGSSILQNRSHASGGRVVELFTELRASVGVSATEITDPKEVAELEGLAQ
jgi:hypothetical protein